MSNLPERYAYAVTRNLPQSQRDEVAKELQVTIEDMASDRAKKGKPTEADIKAVLKELGNPDLLAHKYTATKNYLIGPLWYDAWLRLLKLLLSIVPGIVAAVMLAIGLAQGVQSTIAVIINAIGTGFMVGVHIAFWVTLVFALMERGTIKPGDLDIDSPWTPDDLPELPKHPKRQISMTESITSATLIALGIAWVAASPLLHTQGGAAPLNPALWNGWLPTFFVIASLAVVHEIAKAKIGNWTTPLTVANVLIAALSLGFILELVMTQQIINPDFLHAWAIDTSNPSYITAMKWATAATIATVIAVYVWDVIQSILLNRQLNTKK